MISPKTAKSEVPVGSATELPQEVFCSAVIAVLELISAAFYVTRTSSS